MTNSYSLSKNLKIVFIHGLNNNSKCFDELAETFKTLGHETDLVILPGHGENRKEARTFKEAMSLFDQKMKKFKNTPYVVIAFSQGALFLQLWLEKNPEDKPKRQVLLAPALFVSHQGLVEKALKILPKFIMIKSLSPKAFRRYELMNAWEYQILLDGVRLFQKLRPKFKIPTLVDIDPKDELVDALRLKEELEVINSDLKVTLHERPKLKGLGAHHIMFHPDYFDEEHWKELVRKLQDFLLKE